MKTTGVTDVKDETILCNCLTIAKPVSVVLSHVRWSLFLLYFITKMYVELKKKIVCNENYTRVYDDDENVDENEKTLYVVARFGINYCPFFCLYLYTYFIFILFCNIFSCKSAGFSRFSSFCFHFMCKMRGRKGASATLCTRTQV